MRIGRVFGVLAWVAVGSLISGCGGGGAAAGGGDAGGGGNDTGGNPPRATHLAELIGSAAAASSSSGSTDAASSTTEWKKVSSGSSSSSKKLLPSVPNSTTVFPAIDPAVLALLAQGQPQPHYFATDLGEFWRDFYNAQFTPAPSVTDLYLTPVLQGYYGFDSLFQRTVTRATSVASHRGGDASFSGYDEALKLYYVAGVDETGPHSRYRIDLYKDAAFTQVVGAIRIGVLWNNGNGPVGTYPLDMDVSYHPEPYSTSVYSELSISMLDSSGQSGRYQIETRTKDYAVTYDVTARPSRTTGDLDISAKNGAYMRYSIDAVTGGDKTCTFSASTGLQGSTVQHPDRSGTLEIKKASGASILSFSWDAKGAGTATLWDGTRERFSSFAEWTGS